MLTMWGPGYYIAAHRLKTVIDHNRLIVLDKVEVTEFDTLLNLIQKEDGIFRTMCLKSGTYVELESAARPKVERVCRLGCDHNFASQIKYKIRIVVRFAIGGFFFFI